MTKRIAVLTAFVVLAFPALAGAKIVVNRSIAGITLGTSKASVLKRLGPPAMKKSHNGQTDWIYSGRNLVVGVRNGKVIEVFTQARGQRTAGGIGVGSSIAALKSHVRGIMCQHVSGFQGQECIVFARHGATDWTTDFHVDGGHVTAVLVNILKHTNGAMQRALRLHP